MAQVIKADLDEMVFEDRERKYGAYLLRKSYPRHLIISSGLVLVAFLLISAAPYIQRALYGDGEEDENANRVVKLSMEDLPPPPALDEEKPPPPPPPKVPPPQIKTVAFKIPEPVPEEELEEEEEQTIAEIEELKEAPVIGFEDKEGDDDVGFFDGEIEGDGDVPEVVVEKEPDINAFVFAEEEPQPVNLADIQKAIGYPQIARDAGIEGNVVVRILVDEKGNYQRHKILNSVHPILEKAVEDKIAQLRFTPAIQGGKPIKFWVNVPFAFKLLN